MDNLDDLKAIWHTARTDSLPSSKEMLQFIGTFRRQKLRTKWLTILFSSIFSCLIIAVLFLMDFQLTATYIGGALIALGGFLIALTNLRSLKRFNQLQDCTNLEFLEFIEQTRQNQIYYHKVTMTRVLLLCFVGWLLYLYEPVRQQPLWLVGVYYAAALIYVSVHWFVVRPRAFKKDAEKLEATKSRLESISKQLK